MRSLNNAGRCTNKSCGNRNHCKTCHCSRLFGSFPRCVETHEKTKQKYREAFKKFAENSDKDLDIFANDARIISAATRMIGQNSFITMVASQKAGETSQYKLPEL